MIDYSLDKSDLKGVLQKYHEQFAKGLEIGKKVDLSSLEKQTFKSITISAMGGSALPANILRIFLHDFFKKIPQREKLEVFQNRFYSLPPEAYQNSLNLVCSFSGNTEETLESLKEIISHKLPAIGFSTGGKLEEMCRQNQIPYIKLPKPFPTFQPRLGTGYFFNSIVQILISLKLIPDICEEISTAAQKLPEESKEIEKIGLNLAKKLQNKIIVIYSSTKFKALAFIWKIKFNENSKVPAFWNFFPELNHNEMLGFENPQTDFFVIMLKDSEDHPKNLKRFTVMKQILAEQNIKYEVIDIKGADIFTKIFRTLLIGDWASYFLALLNQVDPMPIKTIERFKKML